MPTRGKREDASGREFERVARTARRDTARSWRRRRRFFRYMFIRLERGQFKRATSTVFAKLADCHDVSVEEMLGESPDDLFPDVESMLRRVGRLDARDRVLLDSTIRIMLEKQASRGDWRCCMKAMIGKISIQTDTKPLIGCRMNLHDGRARVTRGPLLQTSSNSNERERRMKKSTSCASTALVTMSGAAYAQGVSLSGSAEMGIADGADGDANVSPGRRRHVHAGVHDRRRPDLRHGA